MINIEHEVGELGGAEGDDAVFGLKNPKPAAEKMRKAFILELEAMTRLRSPHTVNVYGAITSRSDRLVLVMELLAGGDLRTFLKNADGPLSELVTRRIIEDISAGMAFLQGKNTIHGDLKSPNVLLDGAGRAKVKKFVYLSAVYQ